MKYLVFGNVRSVNGGWSQATRVFDTLAEANAMYEKYRNDPDLESVTLVRGKQLKAKTVSPGKTVLRDVDFTVRKRAGKKIKP